MRGVPRLGFQTSDSATPAIVVCIALISVNSRTFCARHSQDSKHLSGDDLHEAAKRLDAAATVCLTAAR